MYMYIVHVTCKLCLIVFFACYSTLIGLTSLTLSEYHAKIYFLNVSVKKSIQILPGFYRYMYMYYLLIQLNRIGPHSKLFHLIPWPKKYMFRHQNQESMMFRSRDIAIPGIWENWPPFWKSKMAAIGCLRKNVNIGFETQ